jgi:hypothetical protein
MNESINPTELSTNQLSFIEDAKYTVSRGETPSLKQFQQWKMARKMSESELAQVIKILQESHNINLEKVSSTAKLIEQTGTISAVTNLSPRTQNEVLQHAEIESSNFELQNRLSAFAQDLESAIQNGHMTIDEAIELAESHNLDIEQSMDVIIAYSSDFKEYIDEAENNVTEAEETIDIQDQKIAEFYDRLEVMIQQGETNIDEILELGQNYEIPDETLADIISEINPVQASYEELTGNTDEMPMGFDEQQIDHEPYYEMQNNEFSKPESEARIGEIELSEEEFQGVLRAFKRGLPEVVWDEGLEEALARDMHKALNVRREYVTGTLPDNRAAFVRAFDHSVENVGHLLLHGIGENKYIATKNLEKQIKVHSTLGRIATLLAGVAATDLGMALTNGSPASMAITMTAAGLAQYFKEQNQDTTVYTTAQLKQKRIKKRAAANIGISMIAPALVFANSFFVAKPSEHHSILDYQKDVIKEELVVKADKDKEVQGSLKAVLSQRGEMLEKAYPTSVPQGTIITQEIANQIIANANKQRELITTNNDDSAYKADLKPGEQSVAEKINNLVREDASFTLYLSQAAKEAQKQLAQKLTQQPAIVKFFDEGTRYTLATYDHADPGAVKSGGSKLSRYEQEIEAVKTGYAELGAKYVENSLPMTADQVAAEAFAQIDSEATPEATIIEYYQKLQQNPTLVNRGKEIVEKINSNKFYGGDGEAAYMELIKVGMHHLAQEGPLKVLLEKGVTELSLVGIFELIAVFNALFAYKNREMKNIYWHNDVQDAGKNYSKTMQDALERIFHERGLDVPHNKLELNVRSLVLNGDFETINTIVQQQILPLLEEFQAQENDLTKQENQLSVDLKNDDLDFKREKRRIAVDDKKMEAEELQQKSLDKFSLRQKALEIKQGFRELKNRRQQKSLDKKRRSIDK